MERQKVIYALKYIKNIEKDIRFLESLRKGYEDEHYNPSLTPSYAGNIGGKGGYSIPVESMVLAIPTDVAIHMATIKSDIEKKQNEKKEFFNVLNKLDATEKSIMYQFYIKEKGWAEISVHEHYSESHCRRLRDKALGELGELMEKSEILREVGNEKK